MSSRRVVSLLACVVVALAWNGFAGTAFAAPPSNDAIGGATVVSALPYTATLDTSQATTDATDAQANQECGAPATNNSVWFKYTAGPTDTRVAADTTGSTYSTGVLIATGTPGALVLEGCGPVSSGVPTTPGTTYYIMVFADFGPGGTLHVSIHGPGPVPANDKIAHATPIAPLPFSTNVDVSGATTDFVDKQANESCGAPATGNSVWYKFTPGLKHNLLFDASASDYEVGVLVATASEGKLSTIACGPILVTAALKPHTTYYVMAFDAFGEGGGTLRMSISEAPTAKLHVQKYAHIDAHGVVHVKGTYSCTRVTHLRISGTLVEIVGDQVVTGTFNTLGIPASICNGGPHLWSGLVVPPSKAHFEKGKAAVFASGFACGRIACASANETALVNLLVKPGGAATAAHVVRQHADVAPLVTRRTYGNTRHHKTASWGR
jgi:hypothetical protein